MFILIFKFSNINSVLFVLFAYIPPTLAAALIIKSGCVSSILFFVSSYENKLVSDLIDEKTSKDLLSAKILLTAFPTKPLLPKINTLIIDSLKFVTIYQVLYKYYII